MDSETRKDVMAGVDDLLQQAQTSQREFAALLTEHEVTGPPLLTRGARDAFDLLVGTLRRASDALRREGTQYVKDCMPGWFRQRADIDDASVSMGRIEEIRYDGNDQWTVIASTAEYGRERIIVHSDGASYWQVYSSDPA